MAWGVRLSSIAERHLIDLPLKQRQLVIKSIDAMEHDPFVGDVKALQGKEWAGVYRKRVGRHRVIFTADRDSKTISIAAILLRSEKTYR